MSQNKLYVGNLPYSSTEADLADAFGAYGTVQSVNVIMDRETGRPRGFAFVEMPTTSDRGRRRHSHPGRHRPATHAALRC